MLGKGLFWAKGMRWGIFFCFLLFFFVPVANSQEVIRGDLNLNGIPFELEDVGLYEAFFVLYLDAFIIDPDLQILASDINEDGYYGTVADYIMMIRIFVEDNDPPIPASDTIPCQLTTVFANGSLIVAAQTDSQVGSLFLRYKNPDFDDIPVLTLAAEGATLEYDLGMALLIHITDMQYINGLENKTAIIRIENASELLSYNGGMGQGLLEEWVDVTTNSVTALVGDIDLNGVPFESSDMLLCKDALLYGPSVFDIDPVAQADAADLNGDGLSATIEDLQYIIGVINGLLTPGDPTGEDMTGYYINSTCVGTIRLHKENAYSSRRPLGAVLVEFTTPPGTTDFQVAMSPSFDGFLTEVVQIGDVTKLLAYSPEGLSFEWNFGEIMTATFSGEQAELLSVEAAGHMAATNTENVYPRGDANTDGSVNVADAMYMAMCVFLCDFFDEWHYNIMDVNGDEAYNIGDAVYLINYVFKGGPPPAC